MEWFFIWFAGAVLTAFFYGKLGIGTDRRGYHVGDPLPAAVFWFIYVPAWVFSNTIATVYKTGRKAGGYDDD